MFNDVLEIKDMIDLIIRESDGLTHYGVVKELEYISNKIKQKIDKEDAEYEQYLNELALSYEMYDDAMISVGA